MRFKSKSKKIFGFLKKFAVFAVIAAVLFSPVQPFLDVHQAQAKDCPSHNPTQVADAHVGDNEACPPGTGDSTANGDAGTQFGAWLAQIVYVFTVGLGSIVVALAALLLNMAVSLSLDSSAYALQFVSDGWTMMRDLANMAFIFILVYIAMKVMFEAHTAGTMGMLAKVLAVALIINFSFFATRVVIDAGNLISVQFYNAVVSDAPNEQVALFNTPIGQLNVSTGVPDITKKIMGGINFISGLNSTSFSAATAGSDPFSNFVTSLLTFSFIYIVLGVALFLLAAAFITAGVKFIVRIVMLWFAIITAPLALVAWSFQAGGGHGAGGHGGFFKKWREDLIAHAFYPAVFLFVLLLISNFMGRDGAGGLGGTITTGSLQPGLMGILPTLVNILVRLGFVIVMLYFALKADDYFKIAGASVAKTFGNNFGFGLPSWVARSTIGRGAFALSRSQGLRDAAAKNVFAGALWRGANKVGTSTLDARNVRGIGKKLNLGEAPKGGFKATIDARAKRVEETGKLLKDTDLEKAKRKKREDKYEETYEKEHGETHKATDDRLSSEISGLSSKVSNIEKDIKEHDEKAEKLSGEEKNRFLEENAVKYKQWNENKTKLNEQLAVQKATLKTLREQKEARVGSSRDSERIKEFANRISGRNWQNLGMPSSGSVLGAYKVTKGKSTHDQFAEIAQKLAKEEEAEHGHAEEPKAGDGASHGPSGGGGTDHPPAH